MRVVRAGPVARAAPSHHAPRVGITFLTSSKFLSALVAPVALVALGIARRLSGRRRKRGLYEAYLSILNEGCEALLITMILIAANALSS